MHDATLTEYIKVDDNFDGSIYVYSTHDEASRVYQYSWHDRHTEREEARRNAEAYAARLANERGCDWGTNY